MTFFFNHLVPIDFTLWIIEVCKATFVKFLLSVNMCPFVTLQLSLWCLFFKVNLDGYKQYRFTIQGKAARHSLHVLAAMDWGVREHVPLLVELAFSQFNSE